MSERYAGAFNFAFIPFDHSEVEAANISVAQHDTANPSSSISLTLDGATDGFAINHGASNRGDYAVTINGDDRDDAASGILISSIRQNGVDHGQGQGLQYGTIAVEEAAGGRIYAALFEAPSGAEYNANIASAYFNYDHFTGGWARNSVNGGPITLLRSSSDVVLGDNFNQLAPGVFRLDLAGVNTLEDGILLVIGGKNEDNYALSRPLDDGSGFLIEVTDNDKNGGDYEQDPVGFVFLQAGKTDLTFGRVLSDGSSGASQGNYQIEKIDTGRYRLTIDGKTPADGALMVTGEGMDLLNQDNIVSYEADGDGWIIETRDTATSLLQDAGKSVYATNYDHIEVPQIDEAFIGSVEDNIAIWRNADVDYQFVMGHRGGGGYEAHQIVQPEYTRGMIDYALSMGQNMVELDLRTTADGQFVLMHDASIDRTTTGSGNVADMTLDQIRQFQLVNHQTGEILDETVPTLQEVLELAKGRMMLSLDVKPGVVDWPAVMEQVKAADMMDHVVLQMPDLVYYEQLDALRYLLTVLPEGTDIIPAIGEARVSDLDFIRAVFETLKPNGAFISVAMPESDLTPDGGFLFSPEVLALAAEYDVRLTINSLNGGWEHNGTGNGLRNDYLGLNDPDAAWGFWVEKGAGAMMNDEALLAIDYLNKTGARFELDKNNIFASGENDTILGTDADDMIFSLAGRVDRMTGGAGADVFVFGHETSNGIRETDYITDYTVGEDRIRLGDTTVESYREMADRVRLELGGDGDIVWVQGVSSFDEITFV